MESIKDKVAIIGMGCTKFGERWDAGMDDLLVEGAYEAYEDAGIEPKDIQACWYGQASGPDAYRYRNDVCSRFTETPWDSDDAC